MPNPHLEEALGLSRQIAHAWLSHERQPKLWSLHMELTVLAVKVDTEGVTPENLKWVDEQVRDLSTVFKHDPLTTLRFNQMMRQLERAKETL